MRQASPPPPDFRSTFRHSSGSQNWLPLPEGQTYREEYEVEVPKELKAGTYTLQLKLYSARAGRDVMLGRKQDLRDSDGFYTLGEVRVE